ncbi:MAG: hypothetical protein HY820_00210 [Acidobacteria bacterium]|nr:hypothetical protein [Acidobacteriota bacterium]
MSLTEIFTGAITTLTLGLSVLCYLHISRRERENTTRWMKRQQTLEAEIGRLRGSLAEVKERLNEQTVQAATPSPPKGFANAINLNRRAEAIRMFRRGESPEKVAQLLDCPKPEAIFLMKVYRTITAPKPSEPKTAGQPLPVPQPQTRTPQPSRAVFPAISQEDANNAATII